MRLTRTVHGRDGIFGDGSGSYNRVHYGKGYVNAFWDGERMTYGDGDGVDFGPLVSLDVAGHEMSPGVTENTAGLVYSGEPGGVNEATSDIFGNDVHYSSGVDTTSSTCSPRGRAPSRSAARSTSRPPVTARRSPASAAPTPSGSGSVR